MIIKFLPSIVSNIQEVVFLYDHQHNKFQVNEPVL
jgi:hypothetical protein